MKRKISAIILSLLIIFGTCVMSYEKAYANPVLPIFYAIEVLATSLGLTTAATGGLLASLDANKGYNVNSQTDTAYDYLTVNKFLQLYAGLCEDRVTAMQLRYTTDKQLLEYAAQQVKDYLVRTYNYQNNENAEYVTYSIPQSVLDWNEYVSAVNNLSVTQADVNKNNAETQSTAEYLIPVDYIKLMTFAHPNTFIEDKNAWFSNGQEIKENIMSLADGLYSFEARSESYYLNFRIKNYETSKTLILLESWFNTKNYFKLSTEDGIRYITVTGKKIDITNKYIEISGQLRYVDSSDVYPSMYVQKYVESSAQYKDAIAAVGDTVVIPKAVTAKSVLTSTPTKDAETKTISYETAATIPTDIPTNVPTTGETGFWSTVTGFLTSFWDKYSIFGSSFVGTIGGIITGEGDKTRKLLEDEYIKDRTATKEQTGAITGSIDGVKDSVDSLRDSVDSVTDISSSDTINWKPLETSGLLLTTKFPFSLPWDLYKTVKALLIENPTDPIWKVGWHDEILKRDFSFNLDLSKFSAIFKAARVFILVSLNVGLIMGTRKLLGGAT